MSCTACINARYSALCNPCAVIGVAVAVTVTVTVTVTVAATVTVTVTVSLQRAVIHREFSKPRICEESGPNKSTVTGTGDHSCAPLMIGCCAFMSFDSL